MVHALGKSFDPSKLWGYGDGIEADTFGTVLEYLAMFLAVVTEWHLTHMGWLWIG
jgi:hypothetical protein